MEKYSHKWSWTVLENAHKTSWKVIEKQHFQCSVCTLRNITHAYDYFCTSVFVI